MRIGLRTLGADDHALGVNPDREGWDGPDDYEDRFHEPLTTFPRFAGRTGDLVAFDGGFHHVAGCWRTRDCADGRTDEDGPASRDGTANARRLHINVHAIR